MIENSNRRTKVAALPTHNRRNYNSVQKLMTNSKENTMKDRVKRIAIGADHGAFDAKEAIKRYLETVGYKVFDVGTNNNKDKVDYPDFAQAVAKKVVSGDCERGIMLDAAGIGSSMAANKVKGARAALCWNEATIKNSREHNNANVLTMGTLQHSISDMCSMSKLWLETRFEGGRHWPRINKMMSIERM
ncbi:MAG: ribose 5-phosphate isomerase B [Bacteroidales bacterium]|jgi:ribose 5-phosphate isomerase B|nr:ribose 5-phosphate isomerase B [Bacteroidales bacterium]